MSYFKCKHPFASLAVEKEQTIHPITKSRKGGFIDIDKDFELVTYHLFCLKCRQNVKIDHSRTINGVDAFVSKKH